MWVKKLIKQLDTQPFRLTEFAEEFCDWDAAAYNEGWEYDANRNAWFRPDGKSVADAATDAIRAWSPDSLVRELFTYVDAKGHPQTQVDGTADYDVLVAVPASLLRKLRELI